MRIIYVNCVSRNKYESNLDSMKWNKKQIWNKKQKWKKNSGLYRIWTYDHYCYHTKCPCPTPPTPYIYIESICFPFPALWCATNTPGSNSCPLPPLPTVLKHLRMFNAHFQFSLFLWYDNNVKQRYCYGCCAEIGSFMPQAVSFPEKTTVV